MHILKKLIIATVGASCLIISTGIAPVKAALLEFNFTVKELLTNEYFGTDSGFFTLNTQTREIVDSGGVLNPPDGIFLRSVFTVDNIDGNTFLNVKNFKCREFLLTPDGSKVCFGTDNFANEVNLQFRGENLFNQLSSNPFVYENSFVVGTRPEADPDTGFNPFIITGSNFQFISFTFSIPYPVTALQVKNIDTAQVIPESTTTTAILNIGALSVGLMLKRKHKTLF
ncbi:hypothetical protein [Anabaena azotica]|uniref:PEP-CTERM sorting domain-containing protein n=1 Tax=Anabaena azotica FACHB-119 TaxID=947527 RepID=A0ABR8DEF8_9NOST|nr:hypothetical protein [Anabaena azotica]MBD2505494.1 hypothetical protein [Anabaena azotica FACHB-119]